MRNLKIDSGSHKDKTCLNSSVLAFVGPVPTEEAICSLTLCLKVRYVSLNHTDEHS